MTRVEINRGAVRKLVHDPGGPVVQLLATVGVRVVVEASVNFSKHTKTGRGISSLTWLLTGEPSVRCGSYVYYMLYVHEGTEPHEIRPVNAQVLRWVGPGGAVFARRVRHPGTTGDPYLVDAMRTVIRSL